MLLPLGKVRFSLVRLPVIDYRACVVSVIGVGDLSRTGDQAGVVLVKDTEEVVIGAGRNLHSVRCRAVRRAGLASHHIDIDVARVLVVEAHIERPGGRLAKGDLAGDRIAACGRADE